MKTIPLFLLGSACCLWPADDREAALLRAMSSVQNAAERAAKDPARPQFHFRAPGNWINDPNGPIFHRGYYHMFYQHNPYGDAWGHMHWGHARSKDLLHWEHLPIALWPSESKGEKHCFSGCAALNARGEPMIFYTSIGHSKPECWIALPEDPDLIRWKKFDGNPILTEASPGIPYYDFRDPFIFEHQGRTYMVHGGNLNKAKGGQAVVSLYEAENPELTKWKYKSILFQHPDPKVVNIECPLFFSLDDKFVLITSPHRACDYFVGTFDPAAGKFTSEHSGMLDYSGQFYAPNTCLDPKGRRILWGWVRGFKEKRGWNGCLSLPRVLSLEGGKLIQKPASELEALRGSQQPAATGHTRSLEIMWNIESGKASLERGKSVNIQLGGGALDVCGTKLKLNHKNVQLHIFLDHALMEVFVNGGEHCITRVISPETESDLPVRFSAVGNAPPPKTWHLKSIW
jgi:beta-fructofuranosidase